MYQRALQLARQGRPVAVDSSFTPKQKRSLAAAVAKTKAPSRSAASAASSTALVAVRDRATIPAARARPTPAARLRATVNHRALLARLKETNPQAYHELWLRACMPPSWPIPHPGILEPRFTTRSARGLAVRANTTSLSVTVAAGTTAYIMLNPLQSGYPVAVHNNTAFGTTAINMHDVRTDGLPAVTASNYAGWVGEAPGLMAGNQEEDSNDFRQTAATPEEYNATSKIYFMGGHATLQVPTAWDGQAQIRSLFEGDNKLFGRKSQPDHNTYSIGHGHFLPRLTSNMTPATFYSQVQPNPTVVPGNTNKIIRSTIPPDYSVWLGETLGSTASADGTSGNWDTRRATRLNFPFSTFFGGYQIQNTGASNLTFVFSMTCEYWTTVATDTPNSVVGALATSMALTAPRIKPYLANLDKILTHQSLIGEDLGEIVERAGERMPLTHQGIKKDTKDAASTTAAGPSVVRDVEGAGQGLIEAGEGAGKGALAVVEGVGKSVFETGKAIFDTGRDVFHFAEEIEHDVADFL